LHLEELITGTLHSILFGRSNRRGEMGGHATFMGKEKYVDVLVMKPERNHLEYVGADGKIILKWLLKK